AGAALLQDFMLFFNRGKPSDARADDHSHAVQIQFRVLQARVSNRHVGSRIGELGKAVHAPDILFIDIELRLEAFDFGVDLAGIVADVKKRYAAPPGTAVPERVPIRLFSDTNGCNHPDTGYDDAMFHRYRRSIFSRT